MLPDISEFSFGFALTNEIVGWMPISAAPIFPSLIEEGKAGGGYDVKLDAPGIPLYLQFKRADCMVRATARELAAHSLPISKPFYRFKITEKKRSLQHDLLLELDDGSSDVFYAAPRFHTTEEINKLWQTNQVASRSIFVRPRDIGALDDQAHHVAYDDSLTFLCSEPKNIEGISATTLVERLIAQLTHAKAPLREILPAQLERIKSAEQRVLRRRSSELAQYEGATLVRTTRRSLPTPVPTRPSREPKTDGESRLRELSDLANRAFGAQLIVVQLES